MIKRLSKLILVPVSIIFILPFELLFCLLRWIITGKSFYETPLWAYIAFDW